MARRRDDDTGKLTAPAEGPFLRGHTQPVLGANLNGQPQLLLDNAACLVHSDTKWVRAFLDIRKKRQKGTQPAADRDLAGLRKANREYDCGLIVSLKWDFAGSDWSPTEPGPLPEAGSDREQALFADATARLKHIDAPLDYVALGNEPMWETPAEDMDRLGGFMRRLKAHLVEHGEHGDPDYLVGSFNQFGENLQPRFEGFADDMVRFVADDADVVGIDVHTHYQHLDKPRGMLAAARKAVGPEGMVMDTEFSPVWRYKAHIQTPLGEIDGGAAFCEEWDVDPALTVAEYLQNCKARQISPEEYGAWMDAMPFYDGDHLSQMYGLFEEFDVAFGGAGFIQGPWMRDGDWTRAGWSPFHINFLYQGAVLRGDTPAETAHPRYMEDYRRFSG